MEYIKTYFKELGYLFNEMSPYLLLGFFIAGLLHVFISEKKTARLLGRKSIKSVVVASLLGIPLPLCSCGVIPTGVSLHKNGASKGAAISFLISTPQTGIDSILVTYSLLGWPLAIIRPIIALFTGIFGGALTNTLEKSYDRAEPVEQNKNQSKENKPNKIRELFRYAFVEFIQDLAKWMIIGLALAALISVFIPDDFFSNYISNDYLGMLIMLAAAIPIYVCATGSVPIAAVLLMKGLSPGAAIVFLMAGPATNVATITVIAKTMGSKALFGYLFSIIGGAFLFGTLINEFIPRDFITQFIPGHISNTTHENHEMLPKWFKYASSIILVFLIINGYIQKIRTKRKNNLSTNTLKDMNTQFIVKGMTCNHCKANVENNLKALPNIENVIADLDKNIVAIEGEQIDEEIVKKTVEGLGYSFGGHI